MTLDYKTQCAFQTMVDDSIILRYDGALDRLGSAEALEETFERLMDQGQWPPHGYCEADEAERPLSDFRTEADEAFDRGE